MGQTTSFTAWVGALFLCLRGKWYGEGQSVSFLSIFSPRHTEQPLYNSLPNVLPEDRGALGILVECIDHLIPWPNSEVWSFAAWPLSLTSDQSNSPWLVLHQWDHSLLGMLWFEFPRWTISPLLPTACAIWVPFLYIFELRNPGWGWDPKLPEGQVIHYHNLSSFPDSHLCQLAHPLHLLPSFLWIPFSQYFRSATLQVLFQASCQAVQPQICLVLRASFGRFQLLCSHVGIPYILYGKWNVRSFNVESYWWQYGEEGWKEVIVWKGSPFP